MVNFRKPQVARRIDPLSPNPMETLRFSSVGDTVIAKGNGLWRHLSDRSNWLDFLVHGRRKTNVSRQRYARTPSCAKAHPRQRPGASAPRRVDLLDQLFNWPARTIGRNES